MRTSTLASALTLFPLSLSACGETASDTSDGADESSDTGETGGTETGDTATATDDTTGDGDGDGDGDGAAVCGDSMVDPGEQCDDGNDVDDDACSNACEARCGLAWDRTVDAPTADADPAVIVDVAVGTGDMVYAVGTVADGTDKIWIAGYDASGANQWSTLVDSGMNDAEGVEIAVDGDILYVTGAVDSADGTDIWIARYDDTGGEVWSRTIDGMVDGEDAGTGVAVTSAGNPVFVGTVHNADMDSDVWISEVAAADGAEVWAMTHSGAPVSGFSLDRGGPVAVDSNDNVYVQTQIYFSFNTSEAGLAKIPAGGGAPMWEVFPRMDGNAHTHWPQGVVVTDDDRVAFTFDSYEIAVRYYEGWTYLYDAMGTEVWGVTTFDLGLDVDGEDILDEGYITDGLGIDSDGNIVTGGNWYWEDPFQPDRVPRPWTARYDASGTLVCAWAGETEHEMGVATLGLAVKSDGGAVIGGRRIGPPSGMWLGGFRN